MLQQSEAPAIGLAVLNTASGHEPPLPKVSVLLVDDHTIWRGGVRSLLRGTEFEVIGEASSGNEAVELVRQLSPRLVLLDIRMDGGDGLDALQAIKECSPRTSVIMLTTYDNPTYMARAIAGGAVGYLLKGVDRKEMLQALRATAEGEMLLTAEDLARSLRGISPTNPRMTEAQGLLTDREVAVLCLVAAGLTNSGIASLLRISESTVKTHVKHVVGKLGVSDRVQAAVWATRHGIYKEPHSQH